MTAPTLHVRILFAGVLCLALTALLAGPAGAEERVAEITPEEAAEALAEQMRSKDPEARLEAAEAARTNECASLTSPLIKLLGDKSPIIRVAAVDALGARMDKAGRKKAAATLAGRVNRLEKKAEDREELLATLEALRELAQPGPIKGLIGGIKTDSDID
nr:HEAT repeat domain-containing protein [Planctomycetota bacterium]